MVQLLTLIHLKDLLFSRVEGNNIRKNNNILTLSYSEVEWLKQPLPLEARVLLLS